MKYIITCFVPRLFIPLLLFFSIGAEAQDSYKVGDKIEAKWGEKWYPAKIAEIKDGSYYVHYDDGYKEWLQKDHMRSPIKPTQTTTSGKEKGKNTDAGNKVAVQLDNDGLPRISGTGWGMRFIGEKNKTLSKIQGIGQTFNFCKSGKWSITRYALTAGQIGSYTVSGSNVLIKNNTDGKTTKYAMQWDAVNNLLILDDGKWVMKFELLSNNACAE